MARLAWKYITQKVKLDFLTPQPLWKAFCWVLTFISVVNAWVFFRATSFSSAVEILKGMYGFNGVAIPNALLARLGSLSESLLELGITSYIGGGSQFIFTYLWIAILLLVVIIMPNTQQIMRFFSNDTHLLEQGTAVFDSGILPNLLTFRLNAIWAVIMASALVIAIFGLTRVSEFLYFQF